MLPADMRMILIGVPGHVHLSVEAPFLLVQLTFPVLAALKLLPDSFASAEVRKGINRVQPMVQSCCNILEF